MAQYTVLCVAYNPQFSHQFKAMISQHITPSMTSYDGDSHQYDLDMVHLMIEDYNIDMLYSDKSILNELYEDTSISYIEF